MKYAAIWLLVVFIGQLQAQSVLEGYIQEGLKNNIVLQQKGITLEKALYNLKEAHALFLPSVNLNSSYMTGRGGRYFSFPLGDMLNPVYNTLNNLTEANNFPQLENTDVYFNPDNYYDVHIRTSVSILNTDIIYNQLINKEQVKLEQYEVDIYKRELVKSIKHAYYNYLASLSSVGIYESAQKLVQKNIEVNKSLYNNGKGLLAAVLRSESEAGQIQSELVNAKNQVTNSMKYFNFLLNKPLNEPIETDDFEEELLSAPVSIEQPQFSGREELKQVVVGEKMYDYQYKMHKSFWMPKVSAFFDLGSQGTNMEVSSKSVYYLFGAQIDIPIFNGSQNNFKINRSKLDLKYAGLTSRNVLQQLELSADMAKNNVFSAYQEYIASQKQLNAAKSYFKLIEHGYNEDSNSLIEYLDARNQLTSSELKLTINKYKVLQALATLQRETASYQLQK